MSEPFISEIRMFGCSFAPRDWAFCDGAILPISENTALFSLIGVNYGGDGRTTLGLPDLMGRAPIGEGSGPGIVNQWSLGEMGGTPRVALTTTNLPEHSHQMQAENSQADSPTPNSNSFLAINGKETGPIPRRKQPQYEPASASQLEPTNHASIQTTGNSVPHNNMQPYNVLNFCIALSGIYPSRS